jgi:hypothetical protein
MRKENHHNIGSDYLKEESSIRPIPAAARHLYARATRFKPPAALCRIAGAFLIAAPV